MYTAFIFNYIKTVSEEAKTLVTSTIIWIAQANTAGIDLWISRINTK